MKDQQYLNTLIKETFGSFILILLGVGSVIHAVLAPRLAPGAYTWTMIALGWGLAYMTAFLVCGGVSAVHINPAITLAMAFRRGFPWKKVLPTMAAQLLGAFLGAFGLWFMYKDGLSPAGFPNVWATGPGSTYDTAFFTEVTGDYVRDYRLVVACVAELFGTLVFTWLILSVSEAKQHHLNRYWTPVLVGLGVAAIGFSLGGPSGFAINPARDLGPRILGTIMWTQGLFDGLYWLIPPIIIPLFAAPLGVVLYDFLVNREQENKQQN
jgi:glycerol uptake facilitator protein